MLRAVAPLSRADVWAVGNVIMHWNGGSWSVAARVQGTLSAVTAIAPDDIWAVGAQAGDSPRPLIEHWDGRRWTVIAGVRLPRSGGLTAVAARGAHDVWAVGTWAGDTDPTHESEASLLEHWDGRSWHLVPNPLDTDVSEYLEGVAVMPSGTVWIVGSATAGQEVDALIEARSGRRWRALAGGALAMKVCGDHPDTEADGVGVASPSSVFVVGGACEPLIEHWTGRGWSPAQRLSHESGTLRSVAAVSPSDVWAVGDLIVHWNGHRWATVAHRLPYSLTSAATSSEGEIWAAGSYGLSSHGGVVLRYGCRA